MLEDKISEELKDDELYRREGRAYKSEYPLFSWWAWRFYVVVLPVIAIVVTVVLIYQEWARLEYPLLGKIFDLERVSKPLYGQLGYGNGEPQLAYHYAKLPG